MRITLKDNFVVGLLDPRNTVFKCITMCNCGTQNLYQMHKQLYQATM